MRNNIFIKKNKKKKKLMINLENIAKVAKAKYILDSSSELLNCTYNTDIIDIIRSD
jgi:hypothetical protein